MTKDGRAKDGRTRDARAEDARAKVVGMGGRCDENCKLQC